jgi:hypothetical protein
MSILVGRRVVIDSCVPAVTKLIDGELGKLVSSKQRNNLICEAVLYLKMGE